MRPQDLKHIVNTRIRVHLPRCFNLSPPVLQLFLGGQWTTSFSIVNFPSFFSPLAANYYKYEVSLYDENGKLKCSKIERLPPFGSKSIEPREFLGGTEVELGIVSFRIKPDTLLFRTDRHLGVIKPQIFAFYQNQDSRAIGLVHPQTSLLTKTSHRPAWTSNQVIDLAITRKILLYQINPTHQHYRATLALRCIDTGSVIAEQNVSIPPLGTRCSSFNIEEKIEKITISASQLPGPNAKPILFATHKNGAIFTSHT